MYYKIGQIAKMMGVSTHLIKHYEKFHLIQPVKDQESNYRYYDISQCAKIIECKKYRNMGFSLQETVELINMESAKVDQMLSSRVHALEEEKRKLELMIDYTIQYKQECLEVTQNLGEWYVNKIPLMFFLPQSDEHKIIEENTCAGEKYNLIDLIPVSKSMLHLYRQTKEPDQLIWRSEWGICVSSEDKKELNETMDEIIKDTKYMTIPEQRAFVVYLKIRVPYMKSGSLITLILQYYKEFCSKEPEQIYAQLVKGDIEPDGEYQYFKVIIP